MIPYPQRRPGDWDWRDRRDGLSPQDRRALQELIEDERELARDYRQAAQRTRNGQLERLWRGYANEAQRRADAQQDILRRNRPGGWGGPGWGNPGPGWSNPGPGWASSGPGPGVGWWSPGPGWGQLPGPPGHA